LHDLGVELEHLTVPGHQPVELVLDVAELGVHGGPEAVLHCHDERLVQRREGLVELVGVLEVPVAVLAEAPVVALDPQAVAAVLRQGDDPPATATAGASGSAVSRSSALASTRYGTPAATWAARPRRRVARDSTVPTASPVTVSARATRIAAAVRSMPVV